VRNPRVRNNNVLESVSYFLFVFFSVRRAFSLFVQCCWFFLSVRSSHYPLFHFVQNLCSNIPVFFPPSSSLVLPLPQWSQSAIIMEPPFIGPPYLSIVEGLPYFFHNNTTSTYIYFAQPWLQQGLQNAWPYYCVSSVQKPASRGRQRFLLILFALFYVKNMRESMLVNVVF